TEDTQLGVFAEFDPKIPGPYNEVPFLFLGNIHPQLQLDVLDKMTKKPIVAADTMNFWITGTPDLLRQVIARVDLMLVNDAEAQMISGKTNLLDAADAIRAMGPKVVVIKKGSHGAMLFFEGGIFVVPAIPLRTAKDPTGAGDTFAGGMMGYLARQGNIEAETLKQAAVAGTVMASFTVEDFSLNRLGSVGKGEIAERMEQLRALSAFTPIQL
ncbi:MAG: PfkB family carbohydrate kinase, partial [bacterium]|nr:PfkB family carbohydrate kinase [bacterium]